MKTVPFKHPKTKIPMLAEWDEDGRALMFSYQDFESAEKSFNRISLEQVNEWCIQNAINCYSLEQANRHLIYLGINQHFSLN